MKIGIQQINKPNKDFPKRVKQADPVEAGMYKAAFQRFVTLGFQESDFEDGKVQFITVFGFELVEDMAGNKVADFWEEFDDGSRKEGPRTLTREYPLNDDLHHKSNGFMIAKALHPQVPTVRRGKEQEHEYIIDFPWDEHLTGTVLLQVDKKKAKAGHFYNRIQSVMPLGAPLETRLDPVLFNLYDATLQEVYDKDVYGWEKAKLRDRVKVNGEPEVIYGNDEAPKQEPKDVPAEPKIPVDHDDDIPF